MKRITFTKAVIISRRSLVLGITSRAGYPGYLFTHISHPGREFVIARGSNYILEDPRRFKRTRFWLLHDRASGLRLMCDMVCTTLKMCETQAYTYLWLNSPEKLQENLQEQHGRRLSKILELS